MDKQISISLTKKQRKAIAAETGEDFTNLLIAIREGMKYAFFSRAPSPIQLTDKQKEIVKDVIGMEIKEVFFDKLGSRGVVAAPREAQGDPPVLDSGICPEDRPCGLAPIITPDLDVQRVICDFRDAFTSMDMNTVGSWILELYREAKPELEDIFFEYENIAIQARELLEKNASLIGTTVQVKAFPNSADLGLNVTIPKKHVTEAVQFLRVLGQKASPSLKKVISSARPMLEMLSDSTVQEVANLLESQRPDLGPRGKVPRKKQPRK